MPKRIFISGINSSLGYHLVESLRTDHLFIEDYNQIAGTHCTGEATVLHRMHGSVNESFEVIMTLNQFQSQR